jgi:hypothetical protein
LRICYFVAPSLTRGRVCNLPYNCFWALPEQSLLGGSPAELTALFCCLIWDSPNLEGQVPVFISARKRVTQFYPRALGYGVRLKLYNIYRHSLCPTENTLRLYYKDKLYNALQSVVRVEVSGQFHVLAALSPGRSPQYQCDKRLARETETQMPLSGPNPDLPHLFESLYQLRYPGDWFIREDTS